MYDIPHEEGERTLNSMENWYAKNITNDSNENSLYLIKWQRKQQHSDSNRANTIKRERVEDENEVKVGDSKQV